MDFMIEDLDWKKILIRRYKYYHLDEKDLAVIFLLNELNRGVPHLISADEIEPYTAMASDEIDRIMSKLVKLGYANVSGKGSFSIQPLKEKIFNDTVKEVKFADPAKSEEDKEKVKTVYSLVESLIGRQLTPLEYDRITSWMKSGVTLEALKQAAEKVKDKKSRVTVASIDKQLLLQEKSSRLTQGLPADEKTKKILLTPLYKDYRRD